QTDYPWDGKVHITVDTAEPGGASSILLRIPCWAKNATVTINDQAVNAPCESASYAALERKWAAGDIIELDMPMPVRMITADPLVEQTRNQVAVMRGPIVYCLESVDLPEGVRLEEVCLPINTEWTIQHKPDLLGGVGYRQVNNVQPRAVQITMIPYYAWNNRAEPKMTVWLPAMW
ncbi:MAG: glycoside hydrolase family 127 protein, partial [Planctomycetota bacterium]